MEDVTIERTYEVHLTGPEIFIIGKLVKQHCNLNGNNMKEFPKLEELLRKLSNSYCGQFKQSKNNKCD